MVSKKDAQDYYRTFLTPTSLAAFKQLIPEHADMQSVSLEQLLQYADGKDPEGDSATLMQQPDFLPPRGIVSPCAIAWAGLSFNIFSFATGLFALRIPFNERMEMMIAKAFNQTYIEKDAITVLINTLTDGSKSMVSRIFAILSLGRTIMLGETIPAIVKSIFHNLSLMDGLLYGALALATWASALETGGLSLVAYAAASLISIGLIVSAAVNVNRTCFSTVNKVVVTLAGGNGRGPASNQFNNPLGFALDSRGNFYICDQQNHRIQKWSPGLKEAKTVAGGNGPGAGLNQLNNPYSVILDEDENLYISDAFNNRVLSWNINANATAGEVVAGNNGGGSAANQLNMPRGIALDNDGNLYICDLYNSRVQKWAPDGSQGVTVAGGGGSGTGANQLLSISNIAVAKDVIPNNARPGSAIGDMYISDTGNNKVISWKPGAATGTIVAGGHGYGGGANQLNGPYGVAIAGNGDIYVCDGQNNRVQKWTPGAGQGTTVAGGHGSGTASNQLYGPADIIVNKDGSIYVLDAINQRIQKWIL